MAHSISRIAALCISACLPLPTLAADFTGSFTPWMQAESNIFDGVSLSDGIGSVDITASTPNGLTLALNFGTLSATLPMTVAGNVAALANPGIVFGTTKVLDTYLLSDSDHMALAYVAQDQATSAISYVLSTWQRNPVFTDASVATGMWMATSAFGNPNLRDVNGPGFLPRSPFGFEIARSGGGHLLKAGSLSVPVIVSAGHAWLENAPSPAGSGLWQVFEMGYSQGSAAFFFVGTELNDPTDVSITLGLLKPVPEPETWAMLLAGLALLGGTVAGRHRRR